MRLLSFPIFVVLLVMSANSLSQVDIYQSDAYSVEEMCAREAEQAKETDYGSAYENCIEKNRQNPMYHADARKADSTASNSGNPDGVSTESEP